MLRNNIHVGKRGFISGLAKDESGNVIMIMAAAIIPLLAITGGAIDSSRAYMVKERLQAACDAGVLAGRKSMTSKTFNETNKKRAEDMFKFNYEPGMMDTNTIAFIPVGLKETLPGASVQTDSGEVAAKASANMPTVLMRIFGKNNINMSVSCNADFQVPNIDIMMILDVTGSMSRCPDDTIVAGGNTSATPCSTGGVANSQATKIVSLKNAVNKFYATMKVATQASTKTIVRYGFVPYASSVNGKNVDSMKSVFSANADSAQISTNLLASTQVPYESRVAVFDVPIEVDEEQVGSPVVSYETYKKNAPAIVSSTFPSSPPSDGTPISYNDCTGANVASEGYSRNLYFSIDDGINAGTTFTPPNPSGAVLYQVGANLSATQPTTGSYTKIVYSRNDYADQWTSEGYYINEARNYRVCTRKKTTQNFSTGKRIVGYGFSKWIYKPVPYDVTAYRNGGNMEYVNSFDPNTAMVANSGEYNPQQLLTAITEGTRSTSSFVWRGCTEEPETVAATSFSPIIPAAALDLNYNSFPSDNLKTLRPMMEGKYYDGLYFARPTTDAITQNQYAGLPSGVRSMYAVCPSASMRNLKEMSDTDVSSYISTLSPSGATYHDIGMVWGLRLLSKNGMFAGRNLVGSNGGQIDRNIIFMTDGQMEPNNVYTAWGTEETSRRITGTNDMSTEASLHSMRFKALCDAAKFDEGITISVIAFGTQLTSNLTECASDGRAYQANDTTKLDAAFDKIAKSIADLRLTK